MTREEQIKEAADLYIKQHISPKSYFDVDEVFKAGAEWAGTDLNTSSLWHSTDEKPVNRNEQILYLNKFNIIHENFLDDILDYYGSEMDWNEAVERVGIVKWMYAKTLIIGNGTPFGINKE